MTANSESKIKIQIQPALHGDSICLHFIGNDGKNHHIFIDGGVASTYPRTLKMEVEKVINANETIDLFVITHTDQDHIGGVIQFINDYGDADLVDRYWFNYSSLDVPLKAHTDEISIWDGIKLRDYLTRKSKLPEQELTSGILANLYGAELRILSPTKLALDTYKINWQTKEEESLSLIGVDGDDYELSIDRLSKAMFREDVKLENKISIAFVAEIYEKKILFLADSHPSVIINELEKRGYSKENKLHVDYAKLSHHASKFNTSNELLSLLDCQRFIISANGKNRYYLPHKEALARVLCNPERDYSKPIVFIFNYDNHILKKIFTKDELLTYNFSCIHPDEHDYGATILL
jgi:beta-lactamase superfamily II metal-dependent hydrolase